MVRTGKEKPNENDLEEEQEQIVRKKNEELFQDIFGISIEEAAEEEEEAAIKTKTRKVEKKAKAKKEQQPSPKDELPDTLQFTHKKLKTKKAVNVKNETEASAELKNAIMSMPKPKTVKIAREKSSEKEIIKIEEKVSSKRIEKSIADTKDDKDLPFTDKGVLNVISLNIDSKKKDVVNENVVPDVITPKPIYVASKEEESEQDASEKLCPFCGQVLTKDMVEGIELGFIIACNRCGNRIISL
ncbi:MAG: hypothetical protein ACTSRW_12770 [Candidatus Helarchaeota archaeon]